MPPRRRRLRRAATRALITAGAAQAAIAGGLVAIDAIRKARQRRPDAPYPACVFDEVGLELSDDSVRLYGDGDDLFADMLAAIESARSTILLETFIWKGDGLGREFVDALHRKASEGVLVCVVFDGFANLVVPAAFKRFPAPIHTLQFRPVAHPLRALSPRSYLRDHRKLLVVDDDVAFVGGYNIGGRYASTAWRDTHLRLRGPAVRELENAFVDFWNAHRRGGLPELANVGGRSWKPNVVVHRNDPARRIFPIRGMYLEAIDRAEHHVFLTHAYFVPDRAFREGLADAVRRGVDVQVIVPWHSNHVLADWAARRHFDELLAAGVRIFGYRDVMIHAKTATIDGVWSTVGTANIDRFSLLGNYEINVEVYDAGLAAQMRQMFELDRACCFELTLDHWRRRPAHAKLVERALESLAPLV